MYLNRDEALQLIMHRLNTNEQTAEKVRKHAIHERKTKQENLMHLIKVIEQLKNKLNVSNDDAERIIDKALSGKETDFASLDQWLNERFLPNVVIISEEAYAEMCINALRILPTVAATDYGSSRQRDFGQKWADITRGYLGEYAFKAFLQQRFGIESKLGHDPGQLDDYLPMDIHQIKEPGVEWRVPRKRIGIKTTKWNGIWLDIPGAQFNHSDYHALVKLGVGQDHLFTFFKSLGIFESILDKGKEMRILSHDEAIRLLDDLADFEPIPAYICGFIRADAQYERLSYQGRKGKKIFTVDSWNGIYNSDDLEVIKQTENVTDVKFNGIGSFSHNRAYLFNTGNLLWSKTDWVHMIQEI